MRFKTPVFPETVLRALEDGATRHLYILMDHMDNPCAFSCALFLTLANHDASYRGRWTIITFSQSEEIPLLMSSIIPGAVAEVYELRSRESSLPPPRPFHYRFLRVNPQEVAHVVNRFNKGVPRKTLVCVPDREFGGTVLSLLPVPTKEMVHIMTANQRDMPSTRTYELVVDTGLSSAYQPLPIEERMRRRDHCTGGTYAFHHSMGEQGVLAVDPLVTMCIADGLLVSSHAFPEQFARAVEEGYLREDGSRTVMGDLVRAGFSSTGALLVGRLSREMDIPWVSAIASVFEESKKRPVQDLHDEARKMVYRHRLPSFLYQRSFRVLQKHGVSGPEIDDDASRRDILWKVLTEILGERRIVRLRGNQALCMKRRVVFTAPDWLSGNGGQNPGVVVWRYQKCALVVRHDHDTEVVTFAVSVDGLPVFSTHQDLHENGPSWGVVTHGRRSSTVQFTTTRGQRAAAETEILGYIREARRREKETVHEERVGGGDDDSNNKLKVVVGAGGRVTDVLLMDESSTLVDIDDPKKRTTYPTRLAASKALDELEHCYLAIPPRHGIDPLECRPVFYIEFRWWADPSTGRVKITDVLSHPQIPLPCSCLGHVESYDPETGVMRLENVTARTRGHIAEMLCVRKDQVDVEFLKRPSRSNSSTSLTYPISSVVSYCNRLENQHDDSVRIAYEFTDRKVGERVLGLAFGSSSDLERFIETPVGMISLTSRSVDVSGILKMYSSLPTDILEHLGCASTKWSVDVMSDIVQTTIHHAHPVSGIAAYGRREGPEVIRGWVETMLQEVIPLYKETMVPQVAYDKAFCRLRGIQRVKGVYVQHLPFTPNITVYGKAEDRLRIIQDLLTKCRSLEEGSGGARKRDAISNGAVCPICFDASPNVILTACGHGFCCECMTMYIESCSQAPIVCPQPECREHLAWRDIRKYVSPEHMTDILKLSMESSRLRGVVVIPECPECKSLLQKRNEDGSARCQACSITWCLTCSATSGRPTEAHLGDCDMVLRRQERLQDALKNTEGIKDISPCPVCATPIQKDEGCNHLSCTVEGCGAHFCWGCMEMFDAWSSSPCDGVVEEIDHESNRMWVRVVPGSWRAAIKNDVGIPPPGRLCLKTNFARSLGVDAIEVGTVLTGAVSTYIYDHVNECAFPIHGQR